MRLSKLDRMVLAEAERIERRMRREQRLHEGLLDILKRAARKIQELPLRFEGVEVVYTEVNGKQVPVPAPKEAELWGKRTLKSTWISSLSGQTKWLPSMVSNRLLHSSSN